MIARRGADGLTVFAQDSSVSSKAPDLIREIIAVLLRGHLAKKSFKLLYALFLIIFPITSPPTLLRAFIAYKILLFAASGLKL